MKKILFKSNVLAILSVGLLVAVFTAIGMSFTPVEEETIVEQNDTITTLTKRRSHTTSACGGDHNKTDYAEGIASSVWVNGKSVGDVCLVERGASPTQWEPKESKLPWNCGNNKNNHTKELDWCARVTENGYYFQGWSRSRTGGSITSSASPFTHQMTMPADNEKYESINTPYQETYYAIFSPVTVVATTETVNLTSFAEISGTMTLSQVGGDNIKDFQAVTSIDTSGDGKWTLTIGDIAANGTVKINYTYNPNRTTYKNSTGSLTDEVTFNFGGLYQSSQRFTIRATFPSLAIKAGTAQDLNLVNTSSTASGVATFPVSFADAKSDFRAPVFAFTAGAAASAWTVTQWDYADNLVTVHYTFRGDGANRNNSATLTLTSADGNASNNCTVTATVPPSKVLSATAENLSPVLPETEYRGTAVFEVQYVDAHDVDAHSVSFGTQQGAGIWNVLSSTYRITDAATGKGTVTVNYSYTTAADFAVRQNSNTLTLTLDGGASKSCIITANFPSLAMSVQSNDVLVMTLPEQKQAGKVVFAVTYANGAADFVLPTATDSRWSIIDMQYASLSPSSGTLTVNYTFDNGGEKGDWTTDLTLQTASGATCVATLRAIAEQESDKDAAVTTPAGETTKYEKWADALLAANSEDGCTLRLLRNVELGTLAANQEIKKTMTIDLNGKTLSATLPNTNFSRLLYLNTAGVTLTVKDGRSGGTLKAQGNVAGALYVVQVNKGNLIWESGNIEITNTTGTGNNWNHATGIYLANGTGLTMTGGTITSRHTQAAFAGGIYAEAGSTTDINGGVITATAGSYAYGVRSYGNVTMTAGTINATTTATSYAYGIYMGASANADAAACYYGTLNMTGGTINAETTNTDARGIYLEVSLAASDNAPDGTYSNKASAVGKITGATINVTAGTSTAYGIQVLGDYNSKTNEYFVTEISNAVINATAQASYAYAVRLESAVNNTHGGMYRANAKLTNVTATATALTGSNAAGVYLVQAANIIKAGQAHTGEAFATAAKATIIGGKYTASVKQHYAFGISNAGNYNCDITVSADGKAIAPKDTQLTIRDAEITAIHNGVNSATTADPTKSTDYHTAIGVNYAGAVDIDNCIIVADAKEVRFARGVMLGYGKSTIKNSTITASGRSSVYGIYVNAAIRNGNECIAELTSTNNTISATATSTTTSSVPYISADGAYGLYLQAVQTLATGTFAGDYAAAAKVVVYGDTYKAVSKRNTAIAIYSATRTTTLNGNAEAYPELIINGGTFTAEATNNNAYALQSGGNTIVDGGTFMATAEATQARGMYAVAGKLTATNATLKVTAGTGTAYGVCLDHNIQSYTLLNYAASAELNNLDVNVRTISGNTAEGIYLPATQKLQTEADHATFNSWEQYKGSDDNTEKNYYNTWNTYHQYYKEGALAIATSAVINGGTYTIIANGTTAYGVYASNTVVTTNGQASASVPLTIKNATFIAKTETGTTAYGIRTGGPTTIENSTITAEAATTTARGIYIMDKQTTITNSTIKAITQGRNSGNGNSDCYGIYADANVSNMGWLYRGELISNNNEVTATVPDGNNAYAVYLHAHNATVSTGTYAPMNATYATAAAAEINGGKFTATASGDPAGTPKTGQIAYAFHCAAPSSKNGATAAPVCTIDGGYFWGEAPSAGADISANALTDSLTICGDAYFLNATNVALYLCPEKSIQDLPSEMEAYKQGYRYYLGSATNPGINVCYIKETKTYYQTLVEALHYVNSTTKTCTIIMIADYTLPAGNYILPASATLLIPYYEGQNVAQGIVPAWKNKNAYPNGKAFDPSPFCKLTFASGVNLTVQGQIEASSTLYIGQENWTGRVGGPYGWLQLNEGAHVDLESGAKLIAWGYVTGKGEIYAKDGSVVYEDFQMGDWRGGTISSDIQGNKKGVNGKSVFLITDYYYQNVECPVIFKPGAKSIGYTGVFLAKSGVEKEGKSDPVTMVGETGAMFLMDRATAGSDTWVRKEYDPHTDRLIWTLNSGASLGSMRIYIPLKISFIDFSVDLNTSDYVLPMASNFRIIANEGEIRINNDILLQPGVEMQIRKEATCVVPSGQNIFIYDMDDWSSWGKYYYQLNYSPSWGKANPRTAKQLPDAKVQIAGTLDIQGNLWTTAGGANICSTRENSGKVRFTANAPASKPATDSKTLYQIVGNTPDYEGKAITSAKLKNEDDAFTSTEGSRADDVYTYMADPVDGVYRWISVRDNGCFTELKSSSTTQYIRPSDVVAVVANENGDHAYCNADATRYFINTVAKTTSADCLWWEAEPKGEIDGKVCYMANNPDFDNFGTYYYYDTNSDYWVAKTVTVTFCNFNGDVLTNGDFGNIYNYNTRPQYFGATPARNPADGYVYTWTGWDTERNHQGAAMIGRNEPFPPATANVTYYAHFEGTKKHYTVTFKNEDGYVIESGLWNEGDMPACSVTPQKAPTESEIYTFAYWSPTVTEVTRPAEYKAVYLSSLRPYTVTFANYDGTELHTEDFAYGTVPVYRGTTPVRESNTAYSYTFSGWDKPFEAVKGNITYTAQFTAKEREYGEELEIVDWTDQGPVLNMNGYTSPSASAGWTISADGKDYTEAGCDEDLTLQLALSQTYVADDEVLIQAKGKDGIVESHRKYKVPHVFNADATLGAVAADNSSVIFVRSGKLTVKGDATVAAIYVAPGAELCINECVTLATGKLVLRTSPQAAAVLTNNGTVKGQVYYSRIVRNAERLKLCQIALPFDVTLNDIMLSNGKRFDYSKTIGLMEYNAARRAQKGPDGMNWKGINPNEITTMSGSKGYQLLSTLKAYNEYYFPVTLSKQTQVKVETQETNDIKDIYDAGWNFLCSPSAGRVDVSNTDPANQLKIYEYVEAEGNQPAYYKQSPATILQPAMPFFYQTAANGSLVFDMQNSIVSFEPAVATQQAPRRLSAQNVPTQWLQLYYGANENMADQTNIYLHPIRFTTNYQPGYDGVKMSTSGTRPFVWSSLSYGELAFAALPDSVATEMGIALTVFAPTAQAMTFSLRENDWLSRLQSVYLLDRELQTLTDLLQNDYSYDAAAGTSAGRFVVYPIFRAPDMTDGVELPDTTVASFTAYGTNREIWVNGLSAGMALRCYDLMGRLVYDGTADSDIMTIAVPAPGIYFVQVMDEVQKVIVR
ncbi:MAG: hypothetical protein MSS82_03940 [Bacteroidales bacterium]|nr:hypothetical protein [Bacteroidales bacterium]